MNMKKNALTDFNEYTVLNSINQSIVILDINRIITFWNRFSEVLFGWTSAEVVGNCFLSYSVPSDNQIDINKPAELFGNSSNFNNTYISKIKDGSTLRCNVEFIPIYDNNKVNGYILINTVISKSESEEMFRSLSEAAFECIFLSENGHFLYQNYIAEKTFGYSNEEVLGKPGTHWIVPEDWDVVSNNMKSDYEKPYEVIALRKDGSTFPCVISGKMMNFKGRKIRVTSLRDITDYKESQKQKLYYDSYLSAIIENQPGMMWLKDLNGTLLSVNKEYAKICNMDSVENVVGKKDSDVWSKELAEKHINDDKKVFDSGTSLTVEELVIVNGESRWYETFKNAVLDNNGKVIGTTGYARDITYRKEADEALRKSEAMYKAVSYTANDAIITVDSKAVIVDWNNSAELIFGYNKDEIFGKSLTILMEDKYHSHHNNGFHPNKLPNVIGKTIEVSGIRKNGLVFPMDLSLSKWETSEGSFYTGIIRDITDRISVQSELANSKNFLERIINTLSDPVFVKDREHKFVLLNNKFCEFMGHKRDELIGKSDADFFPIDQVDVFIRKDNEVFESGKDNVNEELFTDSGGEIHTIVTKKSVYLNDNGNKYIVGIIRDITDRKNMEEALIIAKEKAEASDKLKTSFLNNISHEIRTPLNGILGFGELVAQQGITHENKQKFLVHLQKSTKRLMNTVTDYMDISLIVSGCMQVNLEKVNLSELIAKVSGNYFEVSKAKGLQLIKSIPSDCESLVITSDFELLEKALLQLLNNAVKFTSKGGVTINLNKFCDHIIIDVCDTGVGIKKESQQLIFEYFRQESEGIGRFYEGNGLGLSIAKGIIELLGGNISVESKKDFGSTFTITLPYLEQTEVVETVNILKPQNTNIRTPHLLIAEDDESNMYLLEMLFMDKANVKLYKASNGMEAFDLCKKHREINIVLMDLKMPVIDGYTATAMIKAYNPHIKIIALTAYAMSGDERKALNIGCDDYISKPVDFETLYGKIKSLGFDL